MMRSVLWCLAYLGVVCLPLALSWQMDLPPRSQRNELASGLGLLAFSIILVEFVLSGRFRTLSNTLGLDITIRFHQLIARAALAFALLHPFFYDFLPGPPRPWDASRQLTLTTDLSALLPGILAFCLLPAFVLISIYRKDLGYKYERWRSLHGLGALLIVGLLLLHAETAGRYSSEPTLIWTWRILTALAVLAMIYIYVLKPTYQARHPWYVSQIKRLTPRQWDVRIKPKGHQGIRFQAGQFVWLNIGHSPFSLNENPFSISSAPSDDPELGFVIKELGDFTNTLDQVQLGERAYIDSAYGSLTIDGRNEPNVVLIAGGVGIAPMLSILRKMQLENDPRNVTLLYGNRQADQIVAREELDALHSSGRAKVVHVLYEPHDDWGGETGYINADLLDRVLQKDTFNTAVFVLCGPPIMLSTLETALMNRSVPAARILMERFQYD